MGKQAFWQTKSLGEMTPQEWELLCDGCGLCCLYKLEDEEGYYYYTRVACRFLDLEHCRCKDYDRRTKVMPTCVVLDPEKAHEFGWLPPTCAYRLLALGRPLPQWHHLVCGSRDAVHECSISACGFAIAEEDADLEHLEEYVVDWFDNDEED